MLMNATSKLLTRIILQRAKHAIANILRNNQAEFRISRSCIDHIQLRIILDEVNIEK